MSEGSAISILAEAYIASRPRLTSSDLETVAAALKRHYPEAAQHAAEAAACLRQASRHQLTFQTIIKEAAGQ